MKLIKINGAVGILHDEGRIERLFEIDEHAGPNAVAAARIVASVNACDGISIKTLELLASGTSSGTIAERVTAWALFAGRARPSADRIMDEARKALAKQGDL